MKSVTENIADKLKSFFRKPSVMLFEGLLIIAMVVALGFAGANTMGIERIAVMAVALTGAVDSVATLICTIFDKQSKIIGELEEPEIIEEE